MNMNAPTEKPCEDSTVSENKQSLSSELDVLSQENSSKQDAFFDSLLAEIKSLSTGMSELRLKFESRLQYDQTKEEAFNRLYGDLERMRVDTQFEQLRPFYIDLILFFDRLDKAVQVTEKESLSTNDVHELLKSLLDELVEVLYRREIELIKPSPLVFDPTIQRAIGTEITEDGSEDNAIAAVIRHGFRYGLRLVRPEEVIIRKTCIASK